MGRRRATACEVIDLEGARERVFLDHLVRRGTSSETPTVGLDPALQTLTTLPYHVGLIIPGAPPATPGPYMYMLAKASAPAGQRLRVRGLRQLLTIAAGIGVETSSGPPAYLLEREIESPFWHFPDVPPPSWHLRRVPPVAQSRTSNTTSNSDGVAWRDAEAPALLFENSPTDVGGYTAPYGGEVQGNVLAPGLTTFTDMRFRWRDDEAYTSLDIAYDGPCDVALLALLTQTVAGNRLNLPVPSTALPFGADSIPREDAFVTNMKISYSADAVYYRIAGSIIWELEPILATDQIDGKCAY